MALTGAGCSGLRFVENYPSGKLRKSGMTALNGDQIGEWTFYYENGNRQAQGSYVKDIQEGDWSYWFPNGELEMQGAFRGERRSGRWRYFHPSGLPRAQGQFEDGREAGKWTFWNVQGERDQRGDYARGKQTLRWTFWHPGGQKKAEGYFLNGLKVGGWAFWDKAGQPSAKMYAMPPGMQLVREVWEDSDSVRREGFILAGIPEGRWVTWHQGGTRRLDGEFSKGEAVGNWTAWSPSGQPIASGPVVDARPTGDWRVWRSGSEGVWKPENIRPPSGFAAEWTADSTAETHAVDALIDAWLAEAASPFETEAVLAVVEPSIATAPSPEIEKATETRQVVPIRAQPWTVREERNLDKYINSYGSSPRPGTPGGADRYGPVAPVAQQKGNTKLSEQIVGKPLPRTTFRAADGKDLELKSFHGRRKVLFVILRGFAGQVCVYCTAQTKALAPEAARFEALNTEVVVMFPGPESGLDAFLEAYRRTFGDTEAPPYRLVYDPDLEFVEALGLKSSLAFPTALIIDEAGIVRDAYVGQNIADRPSAKALIEKLEALRGK
ncbi:MAG: redoxin family protein [Planctomycetota bacterium]